MESDGSFCLKNLGKCSISVNGNSVDTGQYLTLSGSCVIEVCHSPYLQGTNFLSDYLHLGLGSSSLWLVILLF